MAPHPRPQTRRARSLRHEATEAEQRLWHRLRSRQLVGAKFRRQQPVGPYFADFCSVEVMLIVEVDGGQHTEHRDQDAARTAFLQRCGYRVLRFWNTEVLENPDGVLGRIERIVTERRLWVRRKGLEEGN